MWLEAAGACQLRVPPKTGRAGVCGRGRLSCPWWGETPSCLCSPPLLRSTGLGWAWRPPQPPPQTTPEHAGAPHVYPSHTLGGAGSSGWPRAAPHLVACLLSGVSLVAVAWGQQAELEGPSSPGSAGLRAGRLVLSFEGVVWGRRPQWDSTGGAVWGRHRTDCGFSGLLQLFGGHLDGVAGGAVWPNEGVLRGVRLGDKHL